MRILFTGGFFPRSAKAILGKKVQTKRGLQSVFPKTRFPEKHFQLICVRVQAPAEGFWNVPKEPGSHRPAI